MDRARIVKGNAFGMRFAYQMTRKLEVLTERKIVQSSRNQLTEEFLDELTARLRDAANGQLRELAIDGTSTAVLVFCRTETYYGLQLVMSALERAGDALTQGLAVRLSAEVKGAFFRISFGGESARTMPADGWTPWPSRWRKGG